MIRRQLTEVPLKLDVLQEYEAARGGNQRNSSVLSEIKDSAKAPETTQTKMDEIHARIGYVPKRKGSWKLN